MENAKNALNWFEIPVADFERAQGFYEKIFDFEMPVHEMGPMMMGFLPHDSEAGGVGGAICGGEGYSPSQSGTMVYLNGGSDLDTVLGRVEGAGGSVAAPKTLIAEDVGYFATFNDSEGNRVALHSYA